LLNYQNNYNVERSKLLEYQNFLLVIFKIPTRLFSNLYLAKFQISQQNHFFHVSSMCMKNLIPLLFSTVWNLPSFYQLKEESGD